MWQNLGAAVGNAIQKVKKIQMDLENQLDEAVGVDTSKNINTTAPNSEETGQLDSTSISPSEGKYGDLIEPKEAEANQAFDKKNTAPNIVDEISLDLPKFETAHDDSVLKEAAATTYTREEKEVSMEKKSNNRSRRSRHKKVEDSTTFSEPSAEPNSAAPAAPAADFVTATIADASDTLAPDSMQEPIEPPVIEEASLDEVVAPAADQQQQQQIPSESDEKLRLSYGSKLAIITKEHSQKLRVAEASAIKLKEVIAERERALETAMTKMHELNQQLESSQGQVQSLKRDVAEKNSRLEQLSSEGDLKPKLKKLQDLLAEKDEKLSAFEVEGQGLSKKQGEYEKLIRQLKKDLKEKGEEVAKLKESKEQFVKAIEEMQEVIRKNEAEISNAAKSMAAVAAVNQASNEKMMRLEAEINARSEELVSQRKALEVAWSESNEAKRVLVEVRAERDELKRQLGEGNSKFMETESSRRDVEQREAILKATSKQLQDSLQRQQSDFAAREERLREEANEMRKRWQEAISSRETLATELASSTAPLLRQISSLQDSIRTKTESWQAMEASLTERAFKAEKLAEAAEKKRIVSDEQLIALKEQQELATARLEEYKEKLLALEGQHSQLQKLSATASDQIRELQSQLYFEIGQKQNLQTLMHELEIKKNIEMQELKAALEDSVMKAEVRISQLQSEKDSYFVELKEGRHKDTGTKTAKPPPTSGQRNVPAVKCEFFKNVL